MPLWVTCSDPVMEEALNDIPELRRFTGRDVGEDALPDEATTLKFRYRLERHGLAEQLLAEVNTLLAGKGLLLQCGIPADATLIAVAPATKNWAHKRDPELNSTNKGNPCHIGIDADPAVVHAITGTPTKLPGATVLEAQLHAEVGIILGDTDCIDCGRHPIGWRCY